MLISHTHRFIFTKTKKTAGTSIERYFERYCMAPGQWHPERAGSSEYSSVHGVIGYRGARAGEDVYWWNHMPARQIRDGVGAIAWHRYFRFSSVRNPYEKAVSGFFMTARRQGEPVDDPERTRVRFEQWLAQSSPLRDRDKYLIDGQYCLDDIIRVESCLSDLERVCDRLGLPFEPQRLERLKSGMRPAWATAEAMYSPRSRALVAKAYAFELAFFRYDFPVAR